MSRFIYIFNIIIFCVLSGIQNPPSLKARVLLVGADKIYKFPSEAASVAQDGDTILIDAGEYIGKLQKHGLDECVLTPYACPHPITPLTRHHLTYNAYTQRQQPELLIWPFGINPNPVHLTRPQATHRHHWALHLPRRHRPRPRP